mmetsp:Transcript_51589/g.99703  ORF Transcript_51589/g.99703 Transcript_51589/m.99703 type:complete len:215 (+) Transcript_51589:722-1366(+)
MGWRAASFISLQRKAFLLTPGPRVWNKFSPKAVQSCRSSTSSSSRGSRSNSSDPYQGIWATCLKWLRALLHASRFCIRRACSDGLLNRCTLLGKKVHRCRAASSSLSNGTAPQPAATAIHCRLLHGRDQARTAWFDDGPEIPWWHAFLKLADVPFLFHPPRCDTRSLSVAGPLPVIELYLCKPSWPVMATAGSICRSFFFPILRQFALTRHASQ